MRKVLFFIAGQSPTTDEAAQIAAIVGNVQIRSNLQSALYGDKVEPADAVAGTIPAAYKTASGGTAVDTTVFPGGDVTPNNISNIAALAVFPHNPGGIANAGGTKQLIAVKAVVDPVTGVVTLTDVTTSCAWTSATPAKATVGAGTGLVTGAAGGAGSSVITATYDYDGAGSHTPLTATSTATVV
jgi:hypothetical protein